MNKKIVYLGVGIIVVIVALFVFNSFLSKEVIEEAIVEETPVVDVISINNLIVPNQAAETEIFVEKVLLKSNESGGFVVIRREQADEEEVEVLKTEELYVTPSGQVSISLGGETVFSINGKETKKLLNKLENSRENIEEHLKNVREKAEELSGYVSPVNKSEPVFCGRYQRSGYCCETYGLQGEEN